MPVRAPTRAPLLFVVSALTLVAASNSQADTCDRSARAAEARHDLPPGLLTAIGHVESGAQAGRSWTVNPNTTGTGVRFGDLDSARRYVEAQIGSGNRLLDIGCFQIDLFYHPEAFESWQDGFDDALNADAAAAILSRLYARTNDWHQAIALYHSADPPRGQAYLGSVLAAWSGKPRTDLERTDAAPPDPYTVFTTGHALHLVVWTPTGAEGPARPSVGARSRLPHVVIP